MIAGLATLQIVPSDAGGADCTDSSDCCSSELVTAEVVGNEVRDRLNLVEQFGNACSSFPITQSAMYRAISVKLCNRHHDIE